jgi:hypothetical protein
MRVAQIIRVEVVALNPLDVAEAWERDRGQL